MNWLPSLQSVQPWHWLVLAGLLMILELAAPGVFFVWLAAAAFMVGALLLVLPFLTVLVQLLLFGMLCVVAVFVGRKYVGRWALGGSGGDRLNLGASRLVGRTVTVTAPIVNGVGRVRVGDSDWRATGPDTAEGKSVLIVAAEGTTLIVREISGSLL